MDFAANKIIIFDANWQYLTFKSFNQTINIITVNNNLYFSCYFNIYKTDKYLNIIIQYNAPASATYRGLYFNSLNNTIYVTGFSKIYIFDLNLNLVDSISTSGFSSWSIQGYKNYFYVGTQAGQLLVIENKVIIKTITVCNGTLVSSILTDNFGFMAISCLFDQISYLFYSENVSYTGMSMAYSVKPWFMNFDMNGRFVLISPSQIDIYY